MHRFYVPPGTLGDTHAQLVGDVASQISRVLRMRVGDQIVLFDGRGDECVARLTNFTKNEVGCEIVSRRPGSAEPAHPVDLYLALLNKSEKYEWALQKCTELGAMRFVPVICERSVGVPPERTRHERWERIIQEAVEQSGRTVLPELAAVLPFTEALMAEVRRLQASGPGKHLVLVPALSATLSLGDVFGVAGSIESVSLFIGPEGGLTDDELSIAEQYGAVLVSMGPRTLRAETAAVATLAIIMMALNELSARPS